jgi:hypothetical protein
MVDRPHPPSLVLASVDREDINRIAAANGARNVRVFGSVGRGESGDSSELDLLVDMSEACGARCRSGGGARCRRRRRHGEEHFAIPSGSGSGRGGLSLKDKRFYASARAARGFSRPWFVGSSPVAPRLLFPRSHFAGVSCLMMQAIDVQTVVFREGEHFVAQCLDVDVSSFGNSEDDALANLREALELYFEDAPADSIAKVEGPEVRRLTLERA